MEEYKLRINKMKQLLKEADCILIGAGSGLSTAAGLKYSGENFQKNYKEFMQKYHFEDLYSASFYEFKTQEEKWAFFSKMILLNRYNKPLTLYKELYDIVKDKNYFVITTNVDGQFEISGFDKEKIFAVQGDYKYLQCENACHNKLYDNSEIVKKWITNMKECKIPSELVMKCPVCGGNMDMNLRKDDKFVQDENWYKQLKAYKDFLKEMKNKNVVLLEIGVGFNTPGIIRFPFEKMTMENSKTRLIRINKDYLKCFLDIEDKTITFNEEVKQILDDLKE